VSDGVGADAAHLCAASGVAARIELSHLPLAEGVQEIARAAGTDALELASSGGEDYELLAALPPEAVDGALHAPEAGELRLTAIGELGPGKGVELIDPAGNVRRPRGFDQLAPRPAPGDLDGPAEA
jgi:thiamine-monophosphate kinase